jgi:two-component system CheB/CheR fusion protein
MAVKKETSATKRSKTKTTTQVEQPLLTVHKQFPIVGIGASAGGLEALEAFFLKMPADTGMAFVLVTHLDPSHTSILPELIQKKTTMKVQQVTDNTKIKPNQIYTIPPNKEMAVLNGTLQLLEMSRSRGHNLPIDSFFRSLVQDQSRQAIGIILSGTGTDGTMGIRAIKGETGMIMIQDPESAKSPGMH